MPAAWGKDGNIVPPAGGICPAGFEGHGWLQEELLRSF
jgi:hypothetical protein